MMSFCVVPWSDVARRRRSPRRPSCRGASSQAAVALIVIDVFISSSGMPSSSVCMSPLWAIETPTLPTSPRGEHVVGVVAGLGRQVEGDREAGLALGQVAAVELVRLAGRRVAGVGAHHPGAVALGQAVLAHSENCMVGVACVPCRYDVMHLGRDRVIGAYEVGRADRRPGPVVLRRDAARRARAAKPRALLLTHIHLDHAGATGRALPPLPRPAGLRARGRRAAPGRPLEAAARAPGACTATTWSELWGEVGAGARGPHPRARAAARRSRASGSRTRPATPRHHVGYLNEATGDAYVGDVAGVRHPALRAHGGADAAAGHRRRGLARLARTRSPRGTRTRSA